VPPGLTSPGFDRLKKIAAPGELRSSWNNHRGNLQSPECRHAFLWADWVLREEDEGDASEEMKALEENLVSLENSLRDADMSSYLRDFIQRQVDAIRMALRIYGIQGVRPIQDALQKVAGAYTLEHAKIEAEHEKGSAQSKSILERTGQIVEKTAKVCDSIDKIRKFSENAWSLAAAVGPLILPYLPKLSV
jgi:hypothetical protein